MSNFHFRGKTSTIQFYHICPSKSTVFIKKVIKTKKVKLYVKSFNKFRPSVLTKGLLCDKISLLLGFYSLNYGDASLGGVRYFSVLRERTVGESPWRGCPKVAHRIRKERLTPAEIIFAAALIRIRRMLTKRDLIKGDPRVAENGWYRAILRPM